MLTALLFVSIIPFIGCFGGPKRVKAPSWDPEGMAAKAMEQGDENQDGIIDGDELDKVHGLKAGIKAIDTDGSGGISEEEICSRIAMYAERRTAYQPCRLTFRRKGKPLVDANIKLVPEPFLGGLIEAAEGVSDFDGSVHMTAVGGNSGVRCGFYRIEVTSAATQIPENYNTATILGFESSPNGYPPVDSYNLK